MRILEAQRIVSLDTLFQLADHLEARRQGREAGYRKLVNKLASRISEIQLPRALALRQRKERHGLRLLDRQAHRGRAQAQPARGRSRRPPAIPRKLKDIRGLLAPLLRDTLLAFNYAHYAPPGAQILYTNPVFVRSHDFLGHAGHRSTPGAPPRLYGTGWPSNGGGRLVGSLSTLPYALAEAEQNFLIPAQTQALIWGDLVPQMILSAKIPRWWNVTPAQVHWVGLHLRYGRELLAEAALDADAAQAGARHALAVCAAPARTSTVARLLEQGDVKERGRPCHAFGAVLVARDLAAKRSRRWLLPAGRDASSWHESPKDVNYAAISRAFGTPKPTLANSYEPELLNLRTFPTLMGYSSRIMAESWESNTLYWAALADEMQLAPAQLNVRIPEWTQQLVEQIFASHLEDWPAAVEVAAHGGRRCSRPQPRRRPPHEKAAAFQKLRTGKRS